MSYTFVDPVDTGFLFQMAGRQPAPIRVPDACILFGHDKM